MLHGWRRKAVRMHLSPDAVQEEAQEQSRSGIDMVSVCRAVLRVVARLEESGYTGQNTRQDDVVEHDDLPDPASRDDNSQG